VSEYSAESNTVQGGPGPFAPQDDDPRSAPAASAMPPRGAPGAPNGNGGLPASFGSGGAAVSAGPGAAVASAAANGPQRLAAVVKGRIEVADEVVEKVAALAAIEVEGVADLGGDFERALESVRDRIGIGHKRGDQGVKARIVGREVTVDVVVMVEYGHVVMDVARQVQTNVAVQTHRMLGLNVVEVNVTVDDVKLPEPEKPSGDEHQY
jgi:uncharacterized alkaline shock family protein YloU